MGQKAKFESMAEEKRKREEEEKAQQMARQQVKGLGKDEP